MYGRAQALRREGTAPTTLGIADDLPTRFAYEQLNQLSGMANKVQQAIDRNRKVFEARMRQEDGAVVRKAFDAWRAARYGSVAKQQILRRAIARLQVRVLCGCVRHLLCAMCSLRLFAGICGDVNDGRPLMCVPRC